MSRKRTITTFLLRKSMIKRLSIASEDFLSSSIAPQVMPPWLMVTLNLINLPGNNLSWKCWLTRASTSLNWPITSFSLGISWKLCSTSSMKKRKSTCGHELFFLQHIGRQGHWKRFQFHSGCTIFKSLSQFLIWGRCDRRRCAQEERGLRYYAYPPEYLSKGFGCR